MRDIFLIIFLPIMVYFGFKKPFIGLALWHWTASLPLNVWAYGFAANMRWNLIFALTTILGYFLQRDKNKVKFDGIAILVFVFLIHTAITSILSIGYPTQIWIQWTQLFKTVIFFLFVLLIVNKKLHVLALCWGIIMALPYKGMIEGMKYLNSAGGHNATFGLSPAYSDNNHSALAVLIAMPIILFLINEYKEQKYIRFSLMGLLFFDILYILATSSRGAFIGLIILAGYFWLKSSRKIVIILIAVFILGAASTLVDKEWVARMTTIEDAEGDSSFMSRVVSWKMSILMAIKRPLIGGGFNAMAIPRNWFMLAQDFDTLDFIETPEPLKPFVSHSFIFQVLTDHGFVGLFLYLTILAAVFYKLKRTIKTTEELWIKDFLTKIQLSLVVFMVSGALLNAAYYEVIFLIFGLVSVISRMDQNRVVKVGGG